MSPASTVARPNISSRPARSGPGPGASVSDLHGRPPAPGRLAPRLWHHQCRHGSHRCLLDPGLRHPRSARARGSARQRPHVKHVPGRKSDVQDCECCANSTVSACCAAASGPRPRSSPSRALLRHRDTLVKNAGTYVQRMQKGLIEMNLLLPRVVSDITGRTGLLILRALVAGERDPHVLAQHRDPHCHATTAEIAAAHRPLPRRTRLRLDAESRPL